MKYLPRLLAGVTAMIVSAAASAAPVVIDSEQRAAMGLTTALSVQNDTPQHHRVLVQPIKQFTRLALLNLSAGTTHANLKASPNGVTVPCQTSGTLTAKLAPRLPRVLRLEWDECRFLLHGEPLSLDGPGEVLLLSDSLEPTTVGAIRFGNGDTDLVQTREVNFPGYSNHSVYRRNLRIVGLIPLAEFVLPGTESKFAYVLNGFVDETQDYSSDWSPPSTNKFLYTVEYVAYAGVNRVDENWTGFFDELNALFGKVTFQRNEPYYGISFESEEYTGLRVTSRQNPDFTQDTTIDGRVNKVYNRWFGQGCVNGEYTFKTHVPMNYTINSWRQFNSGDLTINGTARARFYSAENTPAGLPVPVNGVLLNLEVRNVGTFNYDTTSASEAIRPIAGCM